MFDYKKSAKLSLWITYFLMLVVAALAIFLPWIITWYAETMHRPQNLATVVMLTCYPCLPFCIVALISLRKLLKNIIKDEIFIEQNISMLRRISWCCLFAGIVLLVAGYFYLPFYIAGAAAVACALITRVFKNIVHAAKEIKED